MLNPELFQKLKVVAPGTELRSALDDIVVANSGALIGFLDDVNIHEDLLQGGFNVETDFSPAKLYELCKMDGAIIIDESVSKILAANVHLTPDSTIPTTETGMRHRAAQRLAKQTEKLVISISKRKKMITLYYKDQKHQLNDISFLITRVNQVLNTLGRITESLNKLIFQIDVEEFENRVQFTNVIDVISRGLEVIKMLDEIEPYVIEAGTEGRFAKMQFHTISVDIQTLMRVMVMDYSVSDLSKNKATDLIDLMRLIEPSDTTGITTLLGFLKMTKVELHEVNVKPRGYRLLGYVSKIPLPIARNVVNAFKDMIDITRADMDALQEIDGIGEKRAHAILGSIRSIKNQIAYR